METFYGLPGTSGIPVREADSRSPGPAAVAHGFIVPGHRLPEPPQDMQPGTRRLV